MAERFGFLLLDETEHRVDFLLLLATFRVVAFGISSQLRIRSIEPIERINLESVVDETAFKLYKLVFKC